MKDLNRHITEQQAANWEKLGLELGLKDYHIANICKDHPNKSVVCCGKMLQKWLDSDLNASWNKLEAAIRRIKSPSTDPFSTVSTEVLGKI